MSGSIEVVGGDTSDQATAAILVSVQSSGTHVGTANAPFGFFWQGCTLAFQAGASFIATPDLYAALNASSSAAALITWSD